MGGAALAPAAAEEAVAPDPVGARVRITRAGAAHAAGDRLLVAVGELFKALLRECTHLVVETAMGVVTAALDITVRPGYTAQRHARIRRGGGNDGVAGGRGRGPGRQRMRFHELLSEESGREDSDATASEERAAAAAGGGAATVAEGGDDEAVVHSRGSGSGFVRFVRAVLARLVNLHSLVIPRPELEVRLFGGRPARRSAGSARPLARQGGGVAVMQHSVGALEATQLRAMVLVDAATDAARTLLARAAHAVALAACPRRWAPARDAGAPFRDAPTPALTPTPRPWHPPAAGMSTSRIVGEFCGHATETLRVETADGYLLRVIRIANPASRRVALFQHGMLVPPPPAHMHTHSSSGGVDERGARRVRVRRRTPRPRGCPRATYSPSDRARLRQVRGVRACRVHSSSWPRVVALADRHSPRAFARRI